MTNNATLIEEARQTAELWKQLAQIAKWQRRTVSHYQEMMGWPGYFPFNLGLAPKNLSQAINPTSFELFQFIGAMRGETQTEMDIVTEVAGYGSQLGTIIDALLTVLPKETEEPDLSKLSQHERCAIVRLRELAKYIEEAKNNR